MVASIPVSYTHLPKVDMDDVQAKALHYVENLSLIHI